MATTSCNTALSTVMIMPVNEPGGDIRTVVTQSNGLAELERKRVFTQTAMQDSDGHDRLKTARYMQGERSGVLMAGGIHEKMDDVEVDVAQHVEVRQSDELDSDGMDEEDTAEGDTETAADQRVYPCPMTSSGGRPRKHPPQPPKYRCEYCGRGCQKPSVLAKHIRAHTNERPYPCELCGFAFKTKSNLYKHSKSKTHHDKLNSVLQAERLSTNADCSHVPTLARSADSESPDSDNRAHDGALRVLNETAPSDARNLRGQASNCDERTNTECTCEASAVAHHSCSRQPMEPVSTVAVTHNCSSGDRLADKNRAVKAKLRSHIEQKQCGEKAAHERSPSPRGSLNTPIGNNCNSAESLGRHNTPTLHNTLCTTWSCLTKSPICSVIDTKPIESASCKAELNRSCAPVEFLRNEEIAKLSEASQLQSKIDVLIEATDMVGAVKLPRKTEMPFANVHSSLDLLAAAAEAASKLDLDASLASRVPSPAEHVDIGNGNFTLRHNAELLCKVCNLSFAKEHLLHAHQKTHQQEQAQQSSCSKQSFSKLSRMKAHHADGHYTSALASPSQFTSVTVKHEELLHSPGVRSADSAEVRNASVHNTTIAANRLPPSNTQLLSSAAENRLAVTLASNSPIEQENPKSGTITRQLDTTAATKSNERTPQGNNAVHSLLRADANNTNTFVNVSANAHARLAGSFATSKCEEAARAANIPFSAVSVAHIPYLTTSNAGLGTPMASIMDPKNIVLLGGTHVGMPVGLHNGPLIAAFALPFGGYTFLPAPGGLYVAAQAQAQAQTANGGLTVSLSAENQLHAIESSHHAQHASSVTESNSDRDNAEMDGTACSSSRPFRCETCKRGFRVQGHLNKHMRSKIHLENVANLELKSSMLVKQ